MLLYCFSADTALGLVFILQGWSELVSSANSGAGASFLQLERWLSLAERWGNAVL